MRGRQIPAAEARFVRQLPHNSSRAVPMAQAGLSDIVATRSFSLLTTMGATESLELQFARPRPYNTSSDFQCEWQLVGSHSAAGVVRRAVGVDSVQAFYLALQMAGIVLATSPEAHERRVAYLDKDNHDLDLPLPRASGGHGS